MEQPLQISWNNFTWWMNDQLYQWQSWRYDFSFWVDTQRYDVRPISPSNLIYTYPSIINCIFNKSKVSWNWNIIWTNDWKIYNNTTPVHTLTQGIQGSKIGYMTPIWWTDFKLYYFHETIPSINPKYIHRSNTDWSWFEEAYKTYTSDTGYQSLQPPNWMQVKSEPTRILFSNYNALWQIDSWENITRKVLFPNNENIVWITEFQGSYKIYTSIWELTSKVYQWDWISLLTEMLIDFNWIRINSVVNDGAYDYIMTDSWLYLVAWVQYQHLYNWVNWKLHWKIDNDIIMDFNTSISNINNQLCKYSGKPWYNKWIHPYCLTDITQPTLWIWANIDYDEWNTYFSVNRSLFKINWPRQAWTHTCYIQSLFFMWNNIRFEKIVDYIDLKFSWFTWTELLKLYVQTTDNWSWIKIWEWNNNTISTNNSWLKIPSQNLTAIWKFNKIRFKVEFEKNWSSWWRFYWLDLYGKQDIWK